MKFIRNMAFMAVAALAATCSFADGSNTVSNRVIMVDENGNINVPNVLATTAQLTTNETMLVLAQAAADAAERAAYEGTNIVQGVVSSIMASQLVIYRRGFNDSFGTITVFSPDDDVIITGISLPDIITDDGLLAVDIQYASTLDVASVAPGFLYSSTCVRKSDMEEMSSSNIDPPEPIQSEIITREGKTFSYSYKVRIWCPQEDAGFFCLYMDADEPDGDGSAVNLVGGVKGGFTGTFRYGDKNLEYEGGFLMTVTDAEE